MAQRSEEPVPGHILRQLFREPRRPLALAAALVLAASALAGCSAGGMGSGDRYPEKKRPDAPRSASDGEVLGAHRQDPSDTLDGSLTNEHAAPASPHAEDEAEAAHEQLDYEECLEAQKAPTEPAAGAEARRRPVCSPPPESED